MIPILYAANETSYNHQGLGALSDVISCVVSEERNGAYTLNMVYPIDGIHYEDIALSCVLSVIPYDGCINHQLFRIYKIKKPMNGKVTVEAEHISYQLSLIPAMPFSALTVNAALQGFASNAAESCPFSFWTDKTTEARYTQTIPASIRSRLGGVSGSILDVYGGEYEWDNYITKLHNSRGINQGVTLRYGKNITDIKQEENIQNVITGICPYYASEETVVTLPEKVIESEYASNYPFNRTVALDMTNYFDEVPTQAQLRQKAQSYIENNSIGIPKVSIDVSFLALWQTEEYKDIAPLERVKLCDTVNIYFEKLGIEATAKVIKYEYDVIAERYKKITLGDAKSSLSTKIAEQSAKIKESATVTELENAVNNATSLITGQKGGYIVINRNANGNPYEICIMNTDDIDTATEVWRWNSSGLGYSSTGYAGPYTTAITQDGSIVADFITTGSLNASLITAGLLQDAAFKNFWNMTTGELQLEFVHFDDGIVTIGKNIPDEDMPYSIQINNERMSFLRYGAEVAYLQYNKLHVGTVEVDNKISIGSEQNGGFFDFINSSDNLSVKWRDA